VAPCGEGTKPEVSVKLVISRKYNGVSYRIETELADLKQTDAVGKVMRAIEEWIDRETEPKTA